MTSQLMLSLFRGVVEVALLALIGRGVLGLLAGAGRDGNPVYRFFCLVTRPPLRLIRAVAPRVIIDKHIPVVTFFVLFWLWILLAYIKHSIAG